MYNVYCERVMGFHHVLEWLMYYPRQNTFFYLLATTFMCVHVHSNRCIIHEFTWHVTS